MNFVGFVGYMTMCEGFGKFDRVWIEESGRPGFSVSDAHSPAYGFNWIWSKLS